MSTPFYIGSELSMDTISKIFLQYTGLKDRNSKEIYENDIVLGHGLREVCLGRVIFQGMAFAISGKSKSGHEWFYTVTSNYQDDSCLEVIGNIYENHKRLEER